MKKNLIVWLVLATLIVLSLPSCANSTATSTTSSKSLNNSETVSEMSVTTSDESITNSETVFEMSVTTSDESITNSETVSGMSVTTSDEKYEEILPEFPILSGDNFLSMEENLLYDGETHYYTYNDLILWRESGF